MDKVSGIYAISSKCKPERVYIGSAVNISARWRVHRCLLTKGIHHSPKLQRHYNTYGESDLVYRYLAPCEPEHLIKAEQAFMNFYKPYFNCAQVAGSSFGLRRSEKTREKLREAAKKRPPVSNETRQRRSMALRGRVFSDESLKKMSNSMMGIKNHRYGKHFSEETRRRMSCNSGMAKVIINIETGIFYDSITNAAASVNKRQQYLQRKLSGVRRNNTMFRYADEVDGNKNSE